MMIVPLYPAKRDVTPAKAGVQLEMSIWGETSGWIPAFAGMTPVVLTDCAQ